MKLICDCGNEDIFNTIDESTGKQTRITEEGQYATINKFTLWEQHDQVGIICNKCGKSIWIFT